MKQIHLFLCAVLFFFSTLTAQIPGDVAGNTLWLEATVINNNVSSDVKAKDNVNYFNFNKVISAKELSKSTYKNLLTDKYCLFAVFKSDTEDEKPIITLKKATSEVFITNKAVMSNAEMMYNKVDSKKGILISYISSANKKGKKNNKIIIEDFFSEDKEGKQQLLEVIYFPRLLKPAERQKVETYLSIKYGLSLIGERDYCDSSAEKIWSYKENKAYNNRVTGIGKDELLNLRQLQSGNAQKDGVYLGFGIIDTTNLHNKFEVEDRTFILWGDNNGGIALEVDKKDKSRKIMKRTWKVQVSSLVKQDSLTTQLKISKKEMNLQKNEQGQVYWLAINDISADKFNYAVARYIKQSFEDEEFVYFNNIIWDEDFSGSDLFTLTTGPDYFFVPEAVSDCALADSGKINISIAGGKPPYSISVQSNSFKKQYTASTGYYTIEGIPDGEYSIAVTDVNDNVVKNNVLVDALPGITVSVAPQWYLDNSDEVKITPNIVNNNNQLLNFLWKKDSRILSSEQSITVAESGKYSVSVSNAAGCSKEFVFEVSNKIPNSGWSVYPNPTKKEQKFNISFNLDKEQKVHLNINSLDGKSHIDKDLGIIKEYTYTDAILSSGIYLVTVTIDNKVESTKLIIE